MQDFKIKRAYPMTAADIYHLLQGKTKEERLQWYDTHREEMREAWAQKAKKSGFLDSGRY